MDNYLTLPNDNILKLEKNFDSTDFFRALKLLLDLDLVIYLESTSLDRSVLNTLSKYKLNDIQPIRPGTESPKSEKLHLSLSSELIDALIEISENHAEPEYADHII